MQIHSRSADDTKHLSWTSENSVSMVAYSDMVPWARQFRGEFSGFRGCYGTRGQLPRAVQENNFPPPPAMWVNMIRSGELEPGRAERDIPEPTIQSFTMIPFMRRLQTHRCPGCPGCIPGTVRTSVGNDNSSYRHNCRRPFRARRGGVLNSVLSMSSYQFGWSRRLLCLNWGGPSCGYAVCAQVLVGSFKNTLSVTLKRSLEVMMRSIRNAGENCSGSFAGCFCTTHQGVSECSTEPFWVLVGRFFWHCALCPSKVVTHPMRVSDAHRCPDIELWNRARIECSNIRVIPRCEMFCRMKREQHWNKSSKFLQRRSTMMKKSIVWTKLSIRGILGQNCLWLMTLWSLVFKAPRSTWSQILCYVSAKFFNILNATKLGKTGLREYEPREVTEIMMTSKESSTEFEWNIFPGFTSLHVSNKISNFLSFFGRNTRKIHRKNSFYVNVSMTSSQPGYSKQKPQKREWIPRSWKICSKWR